MKVAAIVPFKCFTRAKSRLRGRYTDEQVEALGRAMLVDVLAELQDVKQLRHIVVATDDVAVSEVARGAGVEVRLETPDPGLNPAIDQATREATELGCTASVVVLGDSPGLAAHDVETLIERGIEYDVVVVPSKDGGTALLWRSPALCIPATFGPESAEEHQRIAVSRDRSCLSLDLFATRTGIDLDTYEEATAFRDLGPPGRTRDLLRSFSV